MASVIDYSFLLMQTLRVSGCDGSRYWAPVMEMGDLDRVLGSKLLVLPLTIEAFGKYASKCQLPVFLSLSFSLSLSLNKLINLKPLPP